MIRHVLKQKQKSKNSNKPLELYIHYSSNILHIHTHIHSVYMYCSMWLAVGESSRLYSNGCTAILSQNSLKMWIFSLVGSSISSFQPKTESRIIKPRQAHHSSHKTKKRSPQQTLQSSHSPNHNAPPSPLTGTPPPPPPLLPLLDELSSSRLPGTFRVTDGAYAAVTTDGPAPCPEADGG